MVRLGITGGIGSGKSYVARLLVQAGVPVYDTDSEAKRLMLSCPAIREGLVGLLGEEVYAGGVLDKALLARYLFAGKDNALRVNAIVHPQVKEDFLHWVSLHKEAEVVALESAILFESGFDDVADAVVAVYAPLEMRVRRAMERDHASEQQVCARIASQMDDREKLRRSDYVIVNDGVQPLQPQVASLLEGLKKGKGRG